MPRRFQMSEGGIEVDLNGNERSFLTGVLDVLVGLPSSGEDPASRRLRVPVYLDDPESNDEWWRLMGVELAAARTADRHVFQRAIMESPCRLSEEEASAFLRVLNEGRLALGARFGLEVEDDHDRLPEEQRDIMDYLGWLLEDLTSELSRSL